MKVQLKSVALGILLFFLLFFAAVAMDQREIVGAVTWGKASFILLLGFMILAGILDGFNPCAFSTLLLWSGFLLNRFGAEVDNPETMEKKRRRLLNYSLLYSLGIISVYLLFGAGLLQLSNLVTPQELRLVAKFFGLMVTVLGLVMLRDAMHIPSEWLIKMPKLLHPLYKRFSQPTTKLAAAGSGVVVGLCSIPCSGAIYLAVLVILQPEPTVERTALLLFYNFGFIVPVVLFATIISSKKLLQSVSKEFLVSRRTLKTIVAIATILMGVMSIYLS